VCAICCRRNCGATVILSTVSCDRERFDFVRNSLELVCPACGKSFTVSVTEMARVNVSEDQLQRGFFGGRRSADASGR
jgi:hypothetical protein